MSKMHAPLSEEREFRIALIQLAVGKNKVENVARACKFVNEAANKGAKIVALPECCNSPYGNNYFPEYAEPIPGTTTESFAKAAKENKVYLVAGSIPERENDKIYNTCTVFDPNGDMVAKYRKMHLFDIDIPGKITFQESKTLTAGNGLATFETPFAKVGLGICYDIRFAELAMLYARKGCHLLLYPGAFNMTTGPAHWQLLQQARAVDNQLYVASISPARDEKASYVAWGHTSIVNPWGEVLTKGDETEQILYADVDLDFMDQVRNQVPISHQRREDMYSLSGGKDE